MSTRLIASTIMSAILLVMVLLALSGCESPSTEPEEQTQYPNHPNQEETTVALSEPEHSVVQYSNEHIQYPSHELPGTGGVRLW